MPVSSSLRLTVKLVKLYIWRSRHRIITINGTLLCALFTVGGHRHSKPLQSGQVSPAPWRHCCQGHRGRGSFPALTRTRLGPLPSAPMRGTQALTLTSHPHICFLTSWGLDRSLRLSSSGGGGAAAPTAPQPLPPDSPDLGTRLPPGLPPALAPEVYLHKWPEGPTWSPRCPNNPTSLTGAVGLGPSRSSARKQLDGHAPPPPPPPGPAPGRQGPGGPPPAHQAGGSAVWAGSSPALSLGSAPGDLGPPAPTQ